MSDKLYIFDAMNFAFRSYYAIKAGLTDQHGRPTNAVFGFARMLVTRSRQAPIGPNKKGDGVAPIASVFCVECYAWIVQAVPAFRVERSVPPALIRSYGVVLTCSSGVLLTHRVPIDDVKELLHIITAAILIV